MVGDIFRGLGLKRAESAPPVEPLDSDALCARLGGPRELRSSKAPAVHGTYLRVDGPQPTEPRTWRAGPDVTVR